MAILVTNTPIRAVNDKFRLLVSCNISCSINGLLLSIVYRGCLLIAFTFNSPTIFVRNNMLIFARHHKSLRLEPMRASYAVGLVKNYPLLQLCRLKNVWLSS